MAEKGGFRKTRIAIWFAMDDAELDTISFLTRGYAKFAKKRYIIMLMGQTTIPSLKGAQIVSSIDDIKL